VDWRRLNPNEEERKKLEGRVGEGLKAVEEQTSSKLNSTKDRIGKLTSGEGYDDSW
jgi:hypothetical protein